MKTLKLTTLLPLLFMMTVCSGPDQKNTEGFTETLNGKTVKNFHSTPEEDLKSTVWDTGYTTITNESRLELLKPHLPTNTGGVYIGVGSVQNFTLAGWMRPDLIYMMDFTLIVSRANRIHIAFFRASPTAQDYLNLWKKENEEKAIAILKKDQGHTADYDEVVKTLKTARYYFNQYVEKMNKFVKEYPYKLYYHDAAAYAWLRDMALKNRIRAVKGNLAGDTTLRSIGEFARKNKMAVTTLYTSNAEEYNMFFPMPEDYRKNVLSLPANKKSVVIRTISRRRDLYPWAPGSDVLIHKGFHYAVQKLSDFQAWLKQPDADKLNVLKIFKAAHPEGRTKKYITIMKGPETEKKAEEQKQ